MRRLLLILTFLVASSPAVAGTGGGGASGASPCVDDGLCETASETCACADCKPLARCNPGQCMTDGECDLRDSCTCPDCALDLYCSDPSHCVADGVCDALTEGCECDDCSARPECHQGGTSIVSSSSGAGGAGGGVMLSGGCALGGEGEGVWWIAALGIALIRARSAPRAWAGSPASRGRARRARRS